MPVAGVGWAGRVPPGRLLFHEAQLRQRLPSRGSSSCGLRAAAPAVETGSPCDGEPCASGLVLGRPVEPVATHWRASERPCW